MEKLIINSKIIVSLNFIFLILTLISCESPESEPEKETNIKFDLSNAKAILIQDNSSSNGRTINNNDGNLFKIDDQGNISSVIDSVKVTFVRAFSQGLYVELVDERESIIRKFYVELDNSFTEIQDEIGLYKGENENGDLIFSDVSILRANSITVEKLQTTLDFPTVQSVSGNLAIITDNSIFQIFNTVTNARYNVNGCNGPRIQSFEGGSKAIIDDCSSQILIDMSNGERTESELDGWNHESLKVNDGVVVLSQGISDIGDFSNYALGYLDQEAKLTVLTDNVFQPGSSFCMNCGEPNTVLFGTAQFLVVRELNKISVVDRNNNNSKKSILDGLNVTKMSLQNDLIYYLAEDNFGASITGIYDLINDNNQVLDNQTQYEDVQTF